MRETLHLSTSKLIAGINVACLGMLVYLAGLLPLSNFDTYLVRSSYVASGGSGTIPLETLSRNLLLAPSLPGYQERLTAELYVNSQRVDFTVGVNEDGNEFPSVTLNYSHAINITLIQRVAVYRASFRSFFNTMVNPPWPLHSADKLPGNSFWRCNGTGVKLTSIERISDELASEAKNPVDYAYRIVEWLNAHNIRYEQSFGGGVMCPSIFLETGRGACGEYASFIAALFKFRGIKSYVYYALIQDSRALITLNSSRSTFIIRGAYPHMFTVVEIENSRVPIDATANAGDPVRGAAAVSLDNVIIVYRVSNSDPNDYLLLYAPNNEAKVSLSVEVSRENLAGTQLGVDVLAGFLAITLLLLGKKWDPAGERDQGLCVAVAYRRNFPQNGHIMCKSP
jgi:hypothetical protein